MDREKGSRISDQVMSMPKTIDKTAKEYRMFNDWLRAELKRRKINQTTMAYYLNLSRKSLVMRLSGKVEWSFREVLEVLDYLECQITEVL